MLTEDAADMLIGDFGEEVTVTSMGDGEFEDETDPIYHSSSQTEGSSSTHKVRLYTTPSKEQLETYGFSEDTESMMYSTDDIAEEGDEVNYNPPGDREWDWVIGTTETNQLSNGPYLFVYQLLGD
jgi:hypothetical protein